jgi:hypothetical protein
MVYYSFKCSGKYFDQIKMTYLFIYGFYNDAVSEKAKLSFLN